jgi:lipoprotein-anchoring transpeptidase ErfK/SrfK
MDEPMPAIPGSGPAIPESRIPESRIEARAGQSRQRRRRTIVVAVVVVAMLAAGGIFVASQFGDDTAAAPPGTTLSTNNGPAVAATFTAAPYRSAITKGTDVAVYATPDASTPPVATLPKQTEYLLPRSFLVFDQWTDWLHVYLPTRPNSSTAWIKASDVRLGTPLDYQITVSLADRTLTLLHNGAVEFTEPAAIGTDENPTPTGTFYYTDPLDLADQPGTAYGVFAIGLSGHSNTLSEFAGGDGQIAIHGTNDPGTIGEKVSHGCVRVNNDVILKLAKLPLGTPVVIT